MAKGKYHDWLTPERLTLIEGWARDGLTDEQIAKEKMHIAYSTLRVWRDKFPVLSAALKKGKEVADYQVENALYKMATGYDYQEIIEEAETDGNNNVIKKHRKVIKKHVQPSVGAICFWLKNRRPDKWSDNPREDVNTDTAKEWIEAVIGADDEQEGTV